MAGMYKSWEGEGKCKGMEKAERDIVAEDEGKSELEGEAEGDGGVVCKGEACGC